MAKVVILKTSAPTVLTDYKKLLHLLNYTSFFPKDNSILIKLNLSWTKFFPACSTPPWQLEGVVKVMLEDGYLREKLLPVENKTVVTDPWRGAFNNGWIKVFKKYGLKFIPLTEVKWVKYRFKSKLLMLDKIFPEGIEIPEMFIGKNVIHLPTLKTHGHSITTGAIKNSFGGLLKEVRHYAHKYIHEVLVDLMLMQKELHPSFIGVMDGTICGNGAGPRTMKPVEKNYLLASNDCVALDAVSAKMMGFEPRDIPYIRMCEERGLGVGDLRKIEIIGEDIREVNFGFKVKRSFVIFGDQLLRKGRLKFLEKPLLHSKLIVWAPIASTIYHDYFWYPLIGRKWLNWFKTTDWGKLFQSYVSIL